MIHVNANGLTSIANLKQVLFPIAKIQIVSALAFRIEKRLPSRFDWLDGSTLSFLFSFVLSSLKPDSIAIPKWLEKLAWTHLLQAALALGLWGNNQAHDKSPKTLAMLIAFLFGSVGTGIGSITGYAASSSLVSSSPLSSINDQALRTCASCLTASFIGGTANFFEVGDIVTNAQRESSSAAALLPVIAAADVGVMSLYFAFLSAIRSSSWLQNLLSPQKPEYNYQYDTVASTTPDFLSSSPLPRPLAAPTTSFKLMIAALAITVVASLVQSRLPLLPGLSVTITTALAIASASVVRKVVEGDGGAPQSLKTSSSSSSRAAGNFALSMFYAVIGFSTNMQQILQLGPPLLVLMLTTLAVHLSVTIGSALLWNRALSGLRSRRGEGGVSPLHVDLDTAVVASNACIGGASTAAAMASCLPRTDLVVPATASGVLGSLVGTHIGLLLYRRLPRLAAL